MINEKIKEYIRKTYSEILQREPDSVGLNHYYTEITNGKISYKDLENILKNSKEYLQLKEKENYIKTISKELEGVISQKQEITASISPEQDREIFVSCFYFSKDEGGIYHLDNGKLNPISEGHRHFGTYFDKDNSLIFTITDGNPQICISKYKNKKFEKIEIGYSKYIPSISPHGILIHNNKLFTIATDGIENGMEATEGEHGKGVGNIIVSDIEIQENKILIKDSKVYNPFNCTHHHHINDICIHNDKLYISSFSYCNENKKYFSKGAISVINPITMNAKMIVDKLKHPHSPVIFENRLYVCSSGDAAIFSINLQNNELKLEYKGIDAHARGLYITENYFFLGISHSIGRTKSSFTNPTFGLLKFNKFNGATERFLLPKNCNNVYMITST